MRYEEKAKLKMTLKTEKKNKTELLTLKKKRINIKYNLLKVNLKKKL